MDITLKDIHTDRSITLNESGEYSFEVDGGKAKANTKTSKDSKPSTGSKRGGVAQQQTTSPDQASTLDPPRHGPLPTVLKAKASNPRFLLAVSYNGDGENRTEIPESVELNQNYPNPFNPETVIRYGVPEQSEVQLNVYNILGQLVRTLVSEQQSAGRYEVSFDGSRLASGMYIYRLKVGTKVLTNKMTLIK